MLESINVMLMRAVPKFTILFFIVCFAASCSTVSIQPYQPPQEIQKLELTNRRKVNLETESVSSFSPAGHQYLFLILPFGNIEILNPEVSLYNKAATLLALRGFNISKEKPEKSNTLRLSINNLQLTAYDLFFIRKIYCEFEITLEVFGPNLNRRFSNTTKTVKSSYKALAFKPQLEHIYLQCLDEAVNQALIDI